MHPDRRRAGRAIRKQRRAEREAAFDYVMSGQFSRDMKAIGDFLVDALSKIAGAFADYGRAIADQFYTPPRRNQLSLTPGPGALARSEVGVPYPTQSEVEALRSPQSDPHESTKESGDALCEMRETSELLPNGRRTIPGAPDPAGAAPRDPHEDEAADCGGWEDH